MITGATAVYGIIGCPVAHSLSPIFWNASFCHLGLDAVYVPFPIAGQGEMKAAVEGLVAAGVAGFNVTRPFKEEITGCLQDLDPLARNLGTANAVRREPDGRLVGTNTDAVALRSILDDFPEHRSILVLGTGGAGRTVLGVLCHRDTPMVYFSNRSASRRNVSFSHGSPPPMPIDWKDSLLKETIATVDVVINCTSLGWDPSDELPALAVLEPRHLYLDLNYGAGSRLLACARARGATVVDGLEFLIRQGMAAFSWMTGRPAPEQVIRESLAPFALNGVSR